MKKAPVKHPKARKRGDVVLLTGKQARQIVTLLGKLQDHLESAIETSLPPGETETDDPMYKIEIAKDRRDWKRAEDLIRVLTEIAA